MPTLTSNEVRSRFLSYFAKNGHTIVPSSSLIPEGRPDPLLHERRHGPVQGHVHRQGDAAPTRARPRRRSAPRLGQAQRPRERRPHRRGTTRSSRCSGTSRSATTSRRTRSGSRGSSSPATSVSTRSVCGSPSTRRTTRRTVSGARSTASTRGGSSGSARRTTSGRWATRARAVRARRSTTTTARQFGPARRTRGRFAPLRRDLEPRVHAVRAQRRRHDDAAARSRRSTRAWGSSASPRRSRAKYWNYDTDSVLADHRNRRGARRREVRRERGRRHGAPRHRRSRARDGVPDCRRRHAAERGARVRAPPDHAPRDPLRREARAPGSVPAQGRPTRSSSTWARPTPSCSSARGFIAEVVRAEEERFAETRDSGLTLLEREFATMEKGGRKTVSGRRRLRALRHATDSRSTSRSSSRRSAGTPSTRRPTESRA